MQQLVQLAWNEYMALAVRKQLVRRPQSGWEGLWRELVLYFRLIHLMMGRGATSVVRLASGCSWSSDLIRPDKRSRLASRSRWPGVCRFLDARERSVFPGWEDSSDALLEGFAHFPTSCWILDGPSWRGCTWTPGFHAGKQNRFDTGSDGPSAHRGPR
jgi:hypothetical protein